MMDEVSVVAAICVKLSIYRYGIWRKSQDETGSKNPDKCRGRG
jgi:hypothetical protein